ncbi:hypothetical protein SAMN02910298_01708 [Pseudobutyrivibrio sp. YE44]|uniref:hypothetical protein n=1 Tax=Pseudobutyrivibrio sp. YE44 TaxID=1520802 RepID=UPI000888007B|nr:hypothetical protein [Pseudobutyrivibrio sp. YE44]SDB34915.1 hypothetical protein SAMN02910298_01708 [Pseudobutyrivibrio sp. YE44]
MIKIKNPLFVLAAGLLLVAGSTFGVVTTTSAQKADGAKVEGVAFSTAKISVMLEENQSTDETPDFKKVAWMDAEGNTESSDLKFTNLDHITPGETYEEDVRVVNDSDYPEYVRVVVRKYWLKGSDKDSSIDPEIIQLHKTGEWIEQDSTSGEEVIYYYKKPLNKGEKAQFINGISFDEAIGKIKEKTAFEYDVPEGKVIESKTTYEYDGKQFKVEMRVDSVQASSADQAIFAAWGVEPEFSGDTLTGVK